MSNNYPNEENVQIIISLLKKNNIRKVIASPGTTNMPLVWSVQHDDFFEVYSSADERSAAYMACGLASESGEPVVLSCTEATASRNYLPGLTEAYYRKIPVLAITSAKEKMYAGHYLPQVIDQSVMPIDTAKLSISIPVIKNSDDFWDCEIKVNNALLELKRHGGGPVHLHLTTNYGGLYDVKTLPSTRLISRITQNDDFPDLPSGKVGIFVGAHSKMTESLIDKIDRFCELNNAVVFCDHTSGYNGRFKVQFAIVAGQEFLDISEFIPETLIYIGEVSGDYYSHSLASKNVWRVSEDGEIRDAFRSLRYVFEMPEEIFFEMYSKEDSESLNSYLNKCLNKVTNIKDRINELTFSNIWIAAKSVSMIPKNSIIHFGILNSLRAWNFFDIPNSVSASSNVGGFGIDGCVSTLIGASLADIDKICFGVFGDLAFFYDMNSIGNHHVGQNVRIMLINNGCGIEFRNYNHRAAVFGEDARDFMAAAEHYGNKSPLLIKNYAENLGFEYMSASSKKEFENCYQRFFTAEITEKPILFEVFTDEKEESIALKSIRNVEKNIKGSYKPLIRNTIGEKNIRGIKKIIGKQ